MILVQQLKRCLGGPCYVALFDAGVLLGCYGAVTKLKRVIRATMFSPAVSVCYRIAWKYRCTLDLLKYCACERGFSFLVKPLGILYSVRVLTLRLRAYVKLRQCLLYQSLCVNVADRLLYVNSANGFNSLKVCIIQRNFIEFHFIRCGAYILHFPRRKVEKHQEW